MEDNSIPKELGARHDDESPLTLNAAAAAARKHWAMAVAVAVAVTAASAFYTLGRIKIYEASATVLFDPRPPRPLGDDVKAVVDIGEGNYWNNKEYYKTQFWLLTSMRVTGAVVSQLNLHKDAGFMTDLPSGRSGAREYSIEQAALKLASALSVEQVKDSRLATITFRDADPGRAQRILNTLIDTFVQQNLDETQEVSDSANDWLHSQLGKLRTDLESSELALHEYKKSKDILSVSLDDQGNMLREEMLKLNEALTAARTQREFIRARRDELSRLDTADPLKVPATELLNSGILQNLRQSYIQAVQERDSLLASGKGEAHPVVTAATARVEAARAALSSEIVNVRGALDRELAASDRQIGGLSGLFKDANSRALDLNLLEIEFNRLRRAKENNEKLLELVMNRSKESDLTRVVRVNNVRIADRAMRPNKPVSPNVPGNLAVGALLGLTLGLALAVAREMLDRSIKTPEDAEQSLGTSVLGLLPQVRNSGNAPAYAREGGRRRGKRGEDPISVPELVVHDFPASAVAEAARALRTNIVFMSPDKPYRTLLVTSPSPSEGKTTVACSIAIAMAQAGQRVALLDCDMRRPRVHKVFGHSNDVGLTTALLQPTVLDEIMLATQVPNLSIIPTGPLPSTPAELLHSASFAQVLAAVRDRFELVVIDSPPIGPVTDATVLSKMVDGTVIVARSFKTRKDLARRAVRTLRTVGARLVGCVLNSVELGRSEYGYQYYSYHQQQDSMEGPGGMQEGTAPS